MSKKSSNPMFNEDNFGQILDAGMATQTTPMTVSGAVNKTYTLVGIMLVTAFFAYSFPSMMLVFIGAFGGLAVYFVASRNLERSHIFAPLYAICEGLFAGAVSAMYVSAYDGIIFQAVLATVTVLVLMLFLYQARIITVTERFRSIVSPAVAAAMVFYLVNWVLYMFSINIPYVFDGGLLSIGITLVLIGVASMNLLLDFDNFEKGEAQGLPKYMEWYFGMGLLFTLVWLYVEFLRLLSYLSSD